MENSKIEWTHHTFNPWIGCTKVSPGCLNCYAAVSTRARVLRAGGHETWGKGAPRSKTKTWGDPHKWNRAAGKLEQAHQIHLELCRQSGMTQAAALADWVSRGEQPWHRPRVFCASLADWLDDEVPIGWLIDLYDLICATPHLDWLLLTKRPENFRPRFEKLRETRTSAGWWLDGRLECIPDNVWIGTTCEDQTRADERIPQLLEIPARVRFLSCEPLLGPVKIDHIRKGDNQWFPMQHIHWIIAGGESGTGARPMHPEWARSLRDQCQTASVPFLFKQWGEFGPATDHHDIRRFEDGTGIARLGKKAAGRLLDGREWNEFPKP